MMNRLSCRTRPSTQDSSSPCARACSPNTLAIGREEPQVEVVHAHRSVRAVDSAVPQLVRTGELGRGEQLAVVHPAQRPVPFAHGVEPHLARRVGAQRARVDPEERRPRAAGHRSPLLLHLLRRRRARARRDRERPAQLLERELAVEIVLAGDSREELVGLVALRRTRRSCTPCQYVHAGSFRPSRRHLLDRRARTSGHSPARSAARTRHSSCSSASAAPSAFANHSSARASWFRAACVASWPHIDAWSSGGSRSWSFFVHWPAAAALRCAPAARTRRRGARDSPAA